MSSNEKNASDKAASGKIRNIGPKSAAWLRQVGIRGLDELREAGAVEAFLKVKRAGFRPSLNLLYAIEGALLDCHWRELGDVRRGELQQAIEAADEANKLPAAKVPGPCRDVTARTAELYEDERDDEATLDSHRD